jgi:hypothetical protein
MQPDELRNRILLSAEEEVPDEPAAAEVWRRA